MRDEKSGDILVSLEIDDLSGLSAFTSLFKDDDSEKGDVEGNADKEDPSEKLGGEEEG